MIGCTQEKDITIKEDGKEYLKAMTFTASIEGRQDTKTSLGVPDEDGYRTIVW